jgi:hypothetical protein
MSMTPDTRAHCPSWIAMLRHIVWRKQQKPKIFDRSGTASITDFRHPKHKPLPDRPGRGLCMWMMTAADARSSPRIQ